MPLLVAGAIAWRPAVRAERISASVARFSVMTWVVMGTSLCGPANLVGESAPFAK
ncbi:hypothetical protein ACFFX0_33015 [Citricoccus parietis]|uniref:Uncharacterized protein n=1 Tax=Citricoccus parietis TaxID=592307 RepID=A0ABV5G9W6_9MICC